MNIFSSLPPSIAEYSCRRPPFRTRTVLPHPADYHSRKSAKTLSLQAMHQQRELQALILIPLCLHSGPSTNAFKNSQICNLKFFTFPQSESVDEVEGQVLSMKYHVVVCWLEELFKETEEGGQTPLPASQLPPSVKVRSLSSFSPTTCTAYSVISECIKKLLMMQYGIFQMSISDSQGDMIGKVQQKILRIKSSIVCQLEMLFKDTEEEAMDVDDYKSSDESEDDAVPFFGPDPAEFKEKHPSFYKEEFRWSSVMNDKEINDYLFVNTFSVELLNAAVVGRVLVKKASSEVEDGAPVELEFVRVVPKDWYVFKLDVPSKRDYIRGQGRYVGWQACFLTPP